MPLIKNKAAVAPELPAGTEVRTAVEQPVKRQKNPVRAGFGQELTDYDLSIQRQISRAGLWQAAVQSPAIMQYAPKIEAYLELVRKVAEDGLKFVHVEDK